MTSWLKRAEDLFEVVDRRAKLVVSELAEEQPDVPPPPDSSNEQGTKGKRTKSKAKAQKRASMDETLRKSDNKQEESDKQGSESNAKPNEMTTSVSFQNDRTIPGTSTSQTSNEQQDKMDDASVKDASSSEVFSNDGREHDGDRLEGPTMASNVEAVSLSSNHELGSDNDAPLRDADPSSTTEALGAELVHGNHDTDPAQNVRLEDADGYLKPDQEKLQSASAAPKPVSNDDKPSKHNDGTAEPLSGQAKEDSTKATSIIKVEEQLDEAQGLLKSTNPTGQSKEARLARVCAGLSSRLQEYKSENAQLEELLAAERELGRSYEDRIKQLQQELSALKTEATRVESNMAEALGAKNSEIETLVSSLDALKKQAALSEGNLASLQANMETLMRNRELTETRMMQALREELALAERRVEEEHAAHNATKKAAMQREVELEHRAVDASTALARAQRTADERAAKAAELEQKVALLEVECASLNQELQDMEGRLRREQKKSPEDPNQLIQMQAWQQEVERARHGQRDAESNLSSLEAELQKMRVEMAAMKRDAEHYSRQEHMELEKRYRELTDLLYYKQTQLETMASEKAAAEFQLEKEIKRLQEAQAEAERSKMSRRASSSWEEDTDMKELEPLPLHQRHLASASIQLRKAAKFLDTGAVRATRILWRYPTARVSLLCYLVFVHLFLMYLLHRLQEQADNFAAQEVAKSMGLSQPNLP